MNDEIAIIKNMINYAKIISSFNTLFYKGLSNIKPDIYQQFPKPCCWHAHKTNFKEIFEKYNISNHSDINKNGDTIKLFYCNWINPNSNQDEKAKKI